MWEWIKALLQSPAVFTNYLFLEQALSKVVNDKAKFELLREKSSVNIKHYSYLDLDNNLCVNYKTFSDTAKVWKQYSDVDSVKVDGGWNLFSNKKFESDSLIKLSDTIMGGTTFDRIRLYKGRNGVDTYFDLYNNCGRKDTLITLFRGSSGCPVVRVDTYIKGKIFMIRELQFVSDRLSPKELRVFDTWKENTQRKAGVNE